MSQSNPQPLTALKSHLNTLWEIYLDHLDQYDRAQKTIAAHTSKVIPPLSPLPNSHYSNHTTPFLTMKNSMRKCNYRANNIE